MLLLFWSGAVLSGYLGYRLHEWWVPAVVACGVVAGQFALFQLAAGDRGPTAQLIGFGLMNLVMFHATFGIGRAIGQRLSQRRKGVR